ncbi:uncharacterized protein LOC121238376 isoform X1 [Juglans microcarpa x Juglans regia]|uniref:uncharacterized protein LOC121238376 isoform X1 n=1 Tax=Juglans microcarpa x Juglans regia TaxID=2249226 RepID=UPI001B7EF9C4|nr:uncharacterized protein LOC121238376 isoform X1 [Juglans microcarpa x Juglans regia]
MEPAKIDWKRTESIFVEDELYELINAPKWVDFLAPENSVDVEAWFCRPNCKHPKTAEDFLKSTPSKLTSSANLSESLPLHDQNRRVAKLKRRGLTQSSNSSNSNPKFNEDSENQNPNMSTPPIHQANSTKAAIKSSIEKKKMTNDMLQNNEVPRLKSTLLARNLFAGQDILNQVTEFCSELKRMATRMREREEVDGLNVEKSEVVVEEKEVKESFCEVLGEVNGRDKERKPLLELRKEESIGKGERSVKEKQRRKKRADEAENVPISLDLDSVWCKRDETLRQIRTNPPSPQCFSATRGWNKTTASKAAKSRLMASGEVLQEMEQNKEVAREESAEKGQSVCIVDAREARTLDVFWFLKPCRLSN